MTGLPDDIRVPLHSLQADIDYLFGRVAGDSSCAPAMAASVKKRLNAIESSLIASPVEDKPAKGMREGECWPKAREVADIVAEGDGVWRSCSGCHELNDGAPTGPWSVVLGCNLGVGCSECGGIGAVWDTADYADMADYLAEAALSTLEPTAPQEGVKPIGYARPIDVEMSGRPFEGRTSFWCSERQTAYYSVPLYASPPVPQEGTCQTCQGNGEVVTEAGRYDQQEAKFRCDNPDVTMVRASDADDYSPSCSYEERCRDLEQRLTDHQAIVARLTKERDEAVEYAASSTSSKLESANSALVQQLAEKDAEIERLTFALNRRIDACAGLEARAQAAERKVEELTEGLRLGPAVADLRKNWSSFCDADPFDGCETFIDRMEKAGLIDLVPVTEEALESPFAHELGIERGGSMWVLTDAGRAALNGGAK